MKSKYWILNPLAAAIIGLTGTNYSWANEAASQNQDLEEVVTIGTRTPGRTATESPVPVDVISETAIINSGAVDTADMLRKLAPSFNMNNTTTSDGQDLMRPATLRSMGPDQVLVLVNGKRRHQQALVPTQENVGRGAAGTDLSSIPLTAIARVEILRDGAAAQYGSDAIAGVINIILKEGEGGSAWTSYRTTDKGDGDTVKFGLNYGVEIGDGGYLNLTYEMVDQDPMNRATKSNWFGASPVYDELLLVGESDVESDAFWVNAALPVAGGELYAFGGYTNKEGESKGFFRGPSDGRVWSALYPSGITPELGTETEDTSLSVGFRKTWGEWDTDVSLTWGENRFEFSNLESLNASYGPTSPTEADDGALIIDQLTINLDGVRAIDLPFAESATLAIGAEWREDGYEQEAGDPVSYDRGPQLCDENFTNSADPGKDPASCIYDDGTGPVNGTTVPGMQGFQGYSPAMEIDTDRDSYAVYADMEMALTDTTDLGFALRYEDFSDFGDTTIGKVTFRQELTEQLAFRAAFSTGFRAPGVQQQFFTQRSITLVNGVLSDTVTLRPDTALAEDFGFEELKEETSQNYSLGLVYNGDRWTSTLDIYQIDIEDRVVYSGNITESENAAVAAVFAANNGFGQILDGVANVGIFTNAVDTKTVGMDWVNEWDFGLDSGDNIVVEATFHMNNTTIESVNSASTIVSKDTVFDSSQQLLLTDGQPGKRATLGLTYETQDWTLTGRANYYGEVSTASYGTAKKTWGAKTLFDLTGNWNLTDNIQLSAGILNLFDTYPDKWGAEGAPFPALGFKYGWTSFPYSLAGREYYLRASLSF